MLTQKGQNVAGGQDQLWGSPIHPGKGTLYAKRHVKIINSRHTSVNSDSLGLLSFRIYIMRGPDLQL